TGAHAGAVLTPARHRLLGGNLLTLPPLTLQPLTVSQGPPGPVGPAGRAGIEVNVVQDFNADPTGTADTTVQIQNAINAVGGTAGVGKGGGVYIPPGQYKVGTLVLKPYTWLRGAARQAQNNTTASVLIGTAGMDVIRLGPFSTNPNNGSDYRISNMTITAGRNLISLNDTVDGSGWRTHIVIENVNFSGASEASLRSYGGLIEEFYVRNVNHSAGQYFLKCENATIGGISGWFDKTAFENVTI